jgi:hypothetical protein
MTTTIWLGLETELFELEDHRVAHDVAQRSGGCVYTYKTSGRSNWLDRGASPVDSLGLVVLPAGLPQTIQMPDDETPTA